MEGGCTVDGKRQGAKCGAGFTLVEVMIAASLATLVLSMCLGAILSVSRATAAASACSAMHGELVASVATVTRDIRAGMLVTDYNSTYPSRIKFTVVADTNGTLREVELRKSPTAPGTLQRKNGANPWYDLVPGIVSNVTFKLYDATGTNLTVNPNDAHVISMQLTVTTRVRGIAYDDSLSTIARMRNK